MPKPGSTLPDAIWSQSGGEGRLTIVGRESNDQRLYADLLQHAATAAAQLTKAGVEPGDRVGIVASPSFDLVASVLAVWRTGGVAALIPAPPRVGSRHHWQELTRGQLRHASAHVLVHDASGGPGIEGVEAVRLTAEGPTDGPEVPVAPDSPAVVAFTSGSTGEPRGIVLSHRTLSVRTRTHAAWGGCLDPRRDHRLGWMPLHQWGLFTDVLCAMQHDVDATILPTPLFMADPGRWLREISRARATYSAAPNFAYGLAARGLEAGPEEPIDLSCWQLAMSAGEAVDHDTLERFARAAEPYGFARTALCPTYGLNEAGGVTGRLPGTGIRVDHVDRTALAEGSARPAESDDGVATFSSCGPPRVGFQVRIVDADGADLPERQVGEVVVAGPLMDGYLDDPEGTAAVIREGWCYSGDLGYLADGELFITGRAKDVIVIRGRNYHAQDIERVIARLPEMANGSCAAIGVRDGGTEALVVVLETQSEEPEVAKAVRQALYAEVAITPADVLFLPPGGLPRTDQGKPRRAQLRQMYLDGSIPQGAGG